MLPAIWRLVVVDNAIVFSVARLPPEPLHVVGASPKRFPTNAHTSPPPKPRRQQPPSSSSTRKCTNEFAIAFSTCWYHSSPMRHRRAPLSPEPVGSPGRCHHQLTWRLGQHPPQRPHRHMCSHGSPMTATYACAWTVHPTPDPILCKPSPPCTVSLTYGKGAV